MPEAQKHLLIVEDEAPLRAAIAEQLSDRGYRVEQAESGEIALQKLADFAFDVIITDLRLPGIDGSAVVEGAVERYPHIIAIVVTGYGTVKDAVEAIKRGAWDFVSKPFNMSRLLAKVRAMLRMAERRHDALSGPIGPAGPLPLLKFCEDSRLSGRLALRSGEESRWADFLGGELALAGGTPEVAGEDPLDLLLAMESGTYRIEQRRLDPEALRRSESRVVEERAPGEPSLPGFVPVPSGRLSMIRVRGQDIQVQTEGENRPEFTVTTVVAREGQVMRKVQSAWHHPFKRREDQEVARTQIDRQHDRVVAMLQGLSVEVGSPVPVPTAPAAALGVDPSLLAWAISFVAEQVRDS